MRPAGQGDRGRGSEATSSAEGVAPSSEGDVSAPLLSVRGLSVVLGGRVVLEEVTFQLRAGDLMGVVGPNGAGKTTLLQALLGLLDTGVEGDVRFGGQPFSVARRRVAFVPQRSAVDWDFPVTVRDVVLQGRVVHRPWWRSASREDGAVVDQALADVGMSSLASRMISDLSGGQQQRVFLARALAQRPEIFVLDEPMTGVDAATEGLVWQILEAHRAAGGASLVVHHGVEAVRRHASRVLLLNRRVRGLGAPRPTLTLEALAETYGVDWRDHAAGTP